MFIFYIPIVFYYYKYIIFKADQNLKLLMKGRDLTTIIFITNFLFFWNANSLFFYTETANGEYMFDRFFFPQDTIL